MIRKLASRKYRLYSRKKKIKPERRLADNLRASPRRGGEGNRAGRGGISGDLPVFVR